MTHPRVLAVDLGATSIRVAAVDLGRSVPEVDVLHRWHHQPVRLGDGTLRWDWTGIGAQVVAGLEEGLATGPVASIGVDGWGVDYGLLDGAGELVASPFSYRDGRTDGWRSVADRIGIERLYQTTGIQLMGINTIFQLAFHDREEMQRAARVVLLPDLLVHQLAGSLGAERSNVSTTGLMDARSGDWSDELLAEIGLDRSLMPEVKSAGTFAGEWRGVPVHLVGSHDTASAFLGMPGGSSLGTVFVSTGSWVIVGIERPVVDTSPLAQAANFSNEAAALGGVRFLKNVIGLWVLERCRPGWGDPPLELLLGEAEDVTRPVPTFDARDHRFLNPADMEKEILDACGLPTTTTRGVIARVVVESIVAGIARVIDELAEITGTHPTQAAVVGGGTQIPLLRRLLAERTRMTVIKGSPEATALGNAVVQGLALGHISDLGEARSWLERSGERS